MPNPNPNPNPEPNWVPGEEQHGTHAGACSTRVTVTVSAEERVNPQSSAGCVRVRGGKRSQSWY